MLLGGVADPLVANIAGTPKLRMEKDVEEVKGVESLTAHPFELSSKISSSLVRERERERDVGKEIGRAHV